MSKKITKYRLDFNWENGWTIKYQTYTIIKETDKTIVYKSVFTNRVNKKTLDIFKSAYKDSRDVELITIGDTTREQFVEKCKQHIEKIVNRYKESYDGVANAQKIFLDKLITEGSDYNE